MDHFPMRTGSGRQAAQWAPFKWVNTVLGNIKTAITGTYHHVSPKHAERYLASFAYRFNRRYDLDSITQRLAWTCTHTKPHPYRVIIIG
ncbi:MAG: transposase [Alphaproteobacteria bacterium]|nr:transposase [Alphaproteobacteria bacterium]